MSTSLVEAPDIFGISHLEGTLHTSGFDSHAVVFDFERSQPLSSEAGIWFPCLVKQLRFTAIFLLNTEVFVKYRCPAAAS